jgi:hypothetical protein
MRWKLEEEKLRWLRSPWPRHVLVPGALRLESQVAVVGQMLASRVMPKGLFAEKIGDGFAETDRGLVARPFQDAL